MEGWEWCEKGELEGGGSVGVELESVGVYDLGVFFFRAEDGIRDSP